MSYLVEINKDIPSRCKDCIMCKNTYIQIEVPGSPSSTTADPSNTYQYKQVYYCTALSNEVIQDICKIHEKCPIVEGVKYD